MPDRLYISNCTMQAHTFYYRGQYLEPGTPVTPGARRGVRPFSIPEMGPGGVGGHNVVMTVPDGALSTVEPQLRKFGFMVVDEVSDATLRQLGPMLGIYSSKPISTALRASVVRHNYGRKSEEGVERRRNAAIANSDQLLKALRETGVPESQLPPGLVVEYEQDVESEQEGRGRLTEGVVVRPDAGRPAPTVNAGRGKGRGRGRARAAAAA